MVHDNAYSELAFGMETSGSFLQYRGRRRWAWSSILCQKTYGLAGARIGFCIGNREIVEKLTALKSNTDYGMFLPVQKAAIAAITGDQSCVKTDQGSLSEAERLLLRRG